MSGATTGSAVVRRLAYVQTVDGPHGRLGVVWFVAVVVACVVGPIGVGLLFGVVATVAALQTSMAWHRAGSGDDRQIAGFSAGLVAVFALVGSAAAGMAVVASAVAAVAAAALAPDRTESVAARAGRVLRTWLLPALAATSVVAMARTDIVAVIILLVLVSGYEVGDYLVGTGANGVVEGPIAGMVAVLVLTFVEAVFQLGPFDARSAWVFGAMVAVLAPLGAPLASALAPSADARVPALRRLDAWLLVAPVWCWMLWDYLVP